MEFLGLDAEILNGGLAGVAGTAILLVLRTIFVKAISSAKEADIKSDLVHLAADSMDRTDKMLSAYESNTEAINRMGTVLDNVKDALKDLSDRLTLGMENIQTSVSPIMEGIQAVQDNLLKSSETRVVVRDIEGNPVVSFTAVPELDDEYNTVLVVTFDGSNTTGELK